MNHYELLYIVGGKLAETEVKGVSDTIDALIAKIGGTVTFTQYWERRKLAYPINHINFGHYVITEFDMLPTKLAELDRQINLSISEVIRHQVVRKETVGTPGTLPRTRDELDAASAEDSGTLPTTAPAVEVTATEEVAAEEKPKRKPAAKAEVKTEEVTEVAPTPKAEEVAATSATEEKTAEEKPALKKKKEKVSFEELDKKLDEILGDLS